MRPHGGFYYVGKAPALVFDTGVPFGLTPRQHNAWMYHGGGIELMRGVYGAFDVVQLRAATPAPRWAAGTARRSNRSRT